MRDQPRSPSPLDSEVNSAYHTIAPLGVEGPLWGFKFVRGCRWTTCQQRRETNVWVAKYSQYLCNARSSRQALKQYVQQAIYAYGKQEQKNRIQHKHNYLYTQLLYIYFICVVYTQPYVYTFMWRLWAATTLPCLQKGRHASHHRESKRKLN